MIQDIPKSTQFFLGLLPLIAFIGAIKLIINDFVILGNILLLGLFILFSVRVFSDKNEIWDFVKAGYDESSRREKSLIKMLFNFVALIGLFLYLALGLFWFLI